MTGAEVEFPDELLVQVDAFAHQVLGPWPRDGVNFAAEVSAPPDASPLERLVAYTGRQR